MLIKNNLLHLDVEYKDSQLVTYLQLPHLQIYSNSELLFETFPVLQYPIFVTVNNRIWTSVIIMILNINNHYLN